jgi:cell wall-associated NlpC family hydrolase
VPDLIVDPQRALAIAQAQEGHLYLFGKKGPMCFDCSGLVTYSISKADGPDWRKTHNAQDLANVLEPVVRPVLGEILLCIYGLDEEHVDHVMWLCPDGRAFGACGGDHTCTTLDRAIELGAKVQYRSTPDYRRLPKSTPLIGYRRLQMRALKLVPPIA